MRARNRSEDGGIVVGWLTKITVVAAIVGVVGFDGLSLLVTKFGVVDQGGLAARTASEAWKNSRDIQTAYEIAAAAASEANAANIVDTKTFRVDDDGTVHLRVEREATTLVLHRIGPLRSWTTVNEPASGRAPL
jgi:hypothetical protein